MSLSEGNIGEEYIVSALNTDDEELEDFLFTLGCYGGEKITIISKVSRNYTVSIRDGRYNIDSNLADAILVVA